MRIRFYAHMKNCLLFISIVVVTLCGCVSATKRLYLYDGYTGFFWGPVQKNGEMGIELKEGCYLLVQLDSDTEKALKTLTSTTVSFHFTGTTINDMILFLNKALAAKETKVRIDLQIPAVWDAPLYLTDTEAQQEGYDHGFITTLREQHMPSISIQAENESIYSVLYDLNCSWGTPFHLVMKGTNVILQVSSYKKAKVN